MLELYLLLNLHRSIQREGWELAHRTKRSSLHPLGSKHQCKILEKYILIYIQSTFSPHKIRIESHYQTIL